MDLQAKEYIIQNNAPSHSEELLTNLPKKVLKTPNYLKKAVSTDVNLIENLWSIIKKNTYMKIKKFFRVKKVFCPSLSVLLVVV